MDTIVTELQDIREELQHVLQKTEESSFKGKLDMLQERVEELERASARLWKEGHENVYYEDFQPCPAGKTYTKPGYIPGTREPSGDPSWRRYRPTKVIDRILEGTDQSDIETLTEVAEECKQLFNDKRMEVCSRLEITNDRHSSGVLDDLLSRTWELSIKSAQDFEISKKPSQPSGNLIDGTLFRIPEDATPPQIEMLAKILWIRDTKDKVKKLTEIITKVTDHMKRVNQTGSKTNPMGEKIFIGHGRSSVWLELEKFLKDRLIQQVDEFNRVPTAGITNIDRLSKMLDQAKFAFLVMTAEDEQADGTMYARMNVIHEAGLFQGRLGFDRAIVLLEEGCEDFTNIEGLGQIRFPKGDIAARFEEIRRLLEERNIVSS